MAPASGTGEVQYSKLSIMLLLATLISFLVMLGFGVTSVFEHFFIGDVARAKSLGLLAFLSFVATFTLFLAMGASVSYDKERRQRG